MHADLETRLLVCERDNRRLRAGVAVLTLLVATALCLLLLRTATATATSMQPSHVGALRVSELVVVDPSGIERVRIGGNLPDAVIDGRRIDRGSKVAGVMLYDRTGQERGGYVTFDTGDNVALTLDGRKGQNALFVAGPDGSTAMQIWHGPHAIELRADESGARLTHTQAGRVTVQQPEVAVGGATCALFRDGLRSEVPGGIPADRVRGICERRFTAGACGTCLDSD